MIQTNPEHEDLTKLGEGATQPKRELETFPNRNPERHVVELRTNEFTCLCPKTGQPDFAEIFIRYVLDQKIVESKSLKLYLWTYRDEGVFHEHFANLLLNDLVDALPPNGVGSRSISTPGAELASKCWPNTEPRRNHPRP